MKCFRATQSTTNELIMLFEMQASQNAYLQHTNELYASLNELCLNADVLNDLSQNTLNNDRFTQVPTSHFIKMPVTNDLNTGTETKSNTFELLINRLNKFIKLKFFTCSTKQ
ncbi:MAG: hypothetical protein JHC93_05835 [Parachlamydiales bacterium]|nr:hypothetical protein [Parachlamydiales bacterium]